MLIIIFENRLHGTMEKFGSVMKSVIFFTAFLQIALARTHSLQYVYTGRTPGTNAPEFTAVGLLDGEQFVYYDNNDRKMIPKVEWIKKFGVVDAGYWERETQNNRAQQALFLATVPTLMQRFNHITGVHTLERMFGCELDDDGKTRGYRRYRYDGEDFISLDMKSGTWTAVKPEAQITKQQWESGEGPWDGKEKPKNWKSYLEKECIVWLKRFVFYRIGEKHTLQYFYTGVTPGINFPEFSTVGQVDGQQFSYYDSNIKKMIPKMEWIKQITNNDPDYWNRNTQIYQGTQENFKVDVDTLMQRFNHSTGVHTVQRMDGCEIDDDGTTRGYRQDGYDGEDFLSLDLKSVSWVAPTPQALITKNKLDAAGAALQQKNYLENECIEWLRKYVIYGRDTLERKVRPEASVFQRHSSSPELVCHATGFFPKSLMITWRKDGEDVHEDVELRETLPNQDGSFQKRSILKVPAEALQKHTYTCVVQHSSLGEELVLEPPKGGAPIGLIVGVIAGLLVLVLVVVGIMVWMKKKKSGFKPLPSRASSVGDSASNKS